MSSSKLARCFDLRYAYLPYVVDVSRGYAQYTRCTRVEQAHRLKSDSTIALETGIENTAFANTANVGNRRRLPSAVGDWVAGS